MDKFERDISKKLESMKTEIVDKDWEQFNTKFRLEKKSFLKFAFKNIYKVAAILLITSLISVARVQYFIID